MRCDRVWRNARIATMAPDRPGLGEVQDGVIAARDGVIAYAGSRADAPMLDAAEVIDCGGRWITPGLIDCHTHLIHAGDRAQEFERRLAGASYEEIARAGGGILSTVAATRAASQAELTAAALPRLDALLAEGVTTLEIKSGYGLSLEHELKSLRAAKALAQARPLEIVTTFLGAHALPPEAAGDADGYISSVVDEMMPAVRNADLAEAVDVFCETIAYSPAQTRRVFEAARRLGLRVKLHAEQLSNAHGAALASEFSALSADHLEHLDDDGAAAMSRAGVVAVLLPGAYCFMRETQAPPIATLRALGVPIALATDCNPGTSPLTSLLLTMNMGATLFRLTVEECLAGVTREAARALGRQNRAGVLQAGMQCDLAIWSIERPSELVYRIGFNPLFARVWRGQ